MRRILVHAGHVVPMHDDSPSDILTLGAIVGRKTKIDPTARRLQHCVRGHRSDFGMNATSWTQIAQDVSEWYRIVQAGAKMYMAAWTKARYAWESFAVTARDPSVPIENHRNVTSRPSRNMLAGTSTVFRAALVFVFEEEHFENYVHL